jgi:hypothetical protein
MTDNTLPNPENIPLKAEEIEFDTHEKCGTRFYEGLYFSAFVAAAGCTCAKPLSLRITEAIRMPYHLIVSPRVFVEQDFPSMEEAEAYAQDWISREHGLVLRDIQTLREMKATMPDDLRAMVENIGTNLPEMTKLLAQVTAATQMAAGAPSTAEPSEGQMVLAPKKMAEDLRELKIVAMGSLPTPSATEEKEPEGFAYPVWHLPRGKA